MSVWWPNKPDAANPAIASRLHGQCLWRGVADPERSAKAMIRSRHIRLVVVAAVLILTGCGKAPAPILDYSRSETITHSLTLGIGNLTVVEIEPNAKQVKLEWKGYNQREGSAFNVPFEVIEVAVGAERYLISDRHVGNNALSINRKKYTFNARAKRILIRFGEGVSIVDGTDYAAARKVYDDPHQP